MITEAFGLMSSVVDTLEAVDCWLQKYDKKNVGKPRKSPEEANATVLLDKHLRPLLHEWDSSNYGLRRGFGSETNDAGTPTMAELDGAQIDDLMNFWQRGKDRLRTHMQMFTFKPPLIRRKVTKFNKLRTFAPEVKKTRKEKAIARHLNSVIDTLYSKLRHYSGFESTSSTPAALATARGELRLTSDKINNPDADQRKGAKSRMAAVLEKLVGEETFFRCGI